MPADPVSSVQRSYPQVYLACHRDHVRTKSNAYHLSAHDSSILAHLDDVSPSLAGELARHLGVSNSTLSASLRRLVALGYIVRERRAGDRRQIELRLSATGVKAMSQASVLDSKRVAALLEHLSVPEQKKAVAGLALLAKAARQYQARAPRRKRW